MKELKSRVCPECGKEFTPRNSMQKCDSISCAISYAKKKQEQKDKREAVSAAREKRRDLRERKIALRTRSEWLDILQVEVNRYVLLRDRNKPCCTCGTTNPAIKYDAGHYRTRGACPELRFELTNIHKQCSVKCNQHGSGMRVEYQHFLINKYGKDHLDWLDGKHPSLKEIFPDIESIKLAIQKQREINKRLRSQIEQGE